MVFQFAIQILKIKIYRTTFCLLFSMDVKLRHSHWGRNVDWGCLRIFGPKRDEVAGECRKLHNEEPNDMYSSPNIFRVIKSRRMRWMGNLAFMRERKGAYGVLVGKPEGRCPLGRPRRRWEDNIKMDLQEVGCGGMDWIDLAQDRGRFAIAIMNLRVPWNAGNFLTSWEPVSFSRRTVLHGVSN